LNDAVKTGASDFFSTEKPVQVLTGMGLMGRRMTGRQRVRIISRIMG